MSIRNLRGQMLHKFYLIGSLLIGCLNATCAKDLFLPLENTRTDWVLTELNPIPLRIQYHGRMTLPNAEDRYVFLVNGRCVYANLNETMPDQFVLKQILPIEVIIQDKTDSRMYTLKLGEICYRTECFCGKVLNKKTGICYTFSHLNNRIKLDKQEILFTMQQNDFNAIRITILAENKVPFSYILHKN